MSSLDAAELARNIIKSLRGHRSQTALSRRLGYSSNVVYTWESGRRDPDASELFRIVDRTGGDPRAAFSRFAVRVDDVDFCIVEGLAAVLDRLRGQARVVDVAERCGVSRYTASRWLRGLTEPRLSEFLMLIDALTLRLVDLVTSLVPPESVPSLLGPFRELEARRRVTFTHPWSQAVLRKIETVGYAALPRHDDAWLADGLGLPVDEVRASMDALRASGLVHHDGCHYHTQKVAVDTTAATLDDRRKARLHWVDVGRERIERGQDGLYSWAVVALSAEDYARLREMHVRYMQGLRQLVDASEPSEVVAVANVQLFELGPDAAR